MSCLHVLFLFQTSLFLFLPSRTTVGLPVLFPSDESVEPPSCPPTYPVCQSASPHSYRLDFFFFLDTRAMCHSASLNPTLSPCFVQHMSLRLYHVALRPASVSFCLFIAGPAAGPAPGPGDPRPAQSSGSDASIERHRPGASHRKSHSKYPSPDCSPFHEAP